MGGRYRWAGAAAGGVAGAAALAASVLLVLRPLSLVLPAGGIDASWVDVTGEAATWPARWGVDLAFTYGPASALVTRYFTDGYLARALPTLAGAAAVAAAAFVLLARRGAAGRRGGAALVLGAVAAEVAALLPQAASDADAFYFALALTLLLLDLVRRPGERLAAAAVLVGAALFGVLALAKSSFGVAAVALFALGDARALAARRRPPTLVPLALAGFLAAFLALGQRLSDLPSYLDLQGQVVAGYGEAMGLAPGGRELGAFLCGAAGLVAVASFCGAPGRFGRLAAGAGVALALAVGTKAGFVRADGHTQIAWSLLGLGGVAVAAGLVLPRSAAAALALALASLLVLWGVGPLFMLHAQGRPMALAGLPRIYGAVGASVAGEAANWGELLRDPSGFAARASDDKAAAWARLRAAEPLPPLAGTVDVIPSEQSAVLANGLDYRPRPSFQEYSTYAPGLIAANRAFYAGERAPDWVIFAADSIDDRYPGFVEGASWPELLRRYEPWRRAGPGVALRRRAAPLPDVLGPPVRAAATLGEPVPVPAGAGPVYARVTVRKTLLGRLAAAVFRPPALSLDLALAGNPDRSYRFIPAIAEAGFLLSPVAEDAATFADIAFGRGGETGAAAVKAFAVTGPPGWRWFYEPDVAVEFRRVSVPAVPPSPGALAFADDLAAALPWRRLVRSLGRGGELDGDRLSAVAPTALTVPVAGAPRLRLAFGIADAAWTEGATEGVCFTVAAPPGAAPSGAAPLWRRCLDPRAAASDRGPQSAEVDLPAGLSEAVVGTACLGNCAWGWAYWSRIEPEGGPLSAAASSRTSRPP